MQRPWRAKATAMPAGRARNGAARAAQARLVRPGFVTWPGLLRPGFVIRPGVALGGCRIGGCRIGGCFVGGC